MRQEGPLSDRFYRASYDRMLSPEVCVPRGVDVRGLRMEVNRFHTKCHPSIAPSIPHVDCVPVVLQRKANAILKRFVSELSARQRSG